MTAPLPATGPLSIGQIADEFTGTAPHSLGEYYRKSVTTAQLQSSFVRTDDVTYVHTSTSNSNIPLEGSGLPIRISQFRGALRYSFVEYNWGGTEGWAFFINQTGWYATSGGRWNQRWAYPIFNFTPITNIRVVIPSYQLGVLGQRDDYHGYPRFDDADWTESAYPGFRVINSSGTTLVETVALAGPTQNQAVYASTDQSVVLLPAGGNYTVEAVVEGFSDAEGSIGDPYVYFPPVTVYSSND
jgi:hypothetical protein